ncbi:uncharacterized protein LY79DRAFT_284288 [Colletotrichum navitas]|uniref:Uncharacterized protein n=1 Tax=Colletotrichum navitas TaxID=681940 RepID=A0AAD8Q9H7_9PEZI|nr:uncharacterized protein LY79DRAFT_284288 [Colletotrichum navitas]KAK1598255.1 hypothetical protein LY79DRAFT_284288 [Colletotrichum navitas]
MQSSLQRLNEYLMRDEITLGSAINLDGLQIRFRSLIALVEVSWDTPPLALPQQTDTELRLHLPVEYLTQRKSLKSAERQPSYTNNRIADAMHFSAVRALFLNGGCPWGNPANSERAGVSGLGTLTHRPSGATVARSTPDRKVIRSNRVGVNFLVPVKSFRLLYRLVMIRGVEIGW